MRGQGSHVYKSLVEATMWAIVGAHGLYAGTWLTRREAINAHVQMLCGPPLAMATDWQRCKRKGDRAVKVRVREL